MRFLRVEICGFVRRPRSGASRRVCSAFIPASLPPSPHWSVVSCVSPTESGRLSCALDGAALQRASDPAGIQSSPPAVQLALEQTRQRREVARARRRRPDQATDRSGGGEWLIASDSTPAWEGGGGALAEDSPPLPRFCPAWLAQARGG